METILKRSKNLQKLECEEGGEFSEIQISINHVLGCKLLCRGQNNRVEHTEKQQS